MKISQNTDEPQLFDGLYANNKYFTHLPENFISMSFSLDLYRGVVQYLKNKDQRDAFINSLHLILDSNDEKYFKVKDDDCFNKSVLRGVNMDNYSLRKGKELLLENGTYYDLENNNRLNIINDDGRIYLNENKDKKYDLILNDAFIGKNPAKTLCTLEFFQNVENSLNEDGIYAINIITSLEGKDSRLLRAEVNTLKRVFKNVSCIIYYPEVDTSVVHNVLIMASNSDFEIPEGTKLYNLELDENEIILTDDYCPVEIIGENH